MGTVKNMSITLPANKLDFIKNYNAELERKHGRKIGASNIIEVCIDGIATGTIAKSFIDKCIKSEFIAQKKARATRKYMATIGLLNTMA